MAFDQQTRNRLARFVSEARDLLSAEFTRQLQNDFGLNPASGEVAGLDKLPFLDNSRRETARLLRATLDHYLAGGDATTKARRDALDRIVREQAFTVLNRLCALRMAEARGLLIASIGRGYQSRGFQLYARLAGAGLGETGDAYRCYLFSVFDEFAVDLPVLFDRFSPQGRLFPREAALLALLDLINHPDIDPLWAEDETIGWIYQYFNSKEERKAMREASQAPRNSRELAVRNQFFTPRYVVEFLTDNTLGRIWHEMTQGETGLKESCRYLVRRPNEKFLGEGVPAPLPADAPTPLPAGGERLGEGPELTQEELLKQPVYIPHRPMKDPRALKMLDPACGSMHFGLYAFDLFERIYEEAWEREQAAGGGALTADFPDREAFLREVPRLIIERNIHGIDIDPRAVQIAGLSLWLRAQKRWHDLGVRAGDRPRIRRSNVACAEPMPGEKALLEEFIKQSLSDSSEDRAVAGIVRRAFEAMALAGEAGSLLKIEEEIAGAIDEARQAWQAARTQPRQAALLREAETPYQTALGIDLRGITDEAFWAQAEQRIYDALRAYAERAGGEGDAQRRLFADDAARGFAFIDLCRQRYDVVLMNPPFGQVALDTYKYLQQHYAGAHHDVYSAFVRRANALGSNSRVGVISSRSFLLASRMEEFRISDILPFLSVIADFGLGVMDDAYVESAAYICDTKFSNTFTVFDLRRYAPAHSDVLLTSKIDEGGILCHPNEFEILPSARILYTLPFSIRKLVELGQSFEPDIGTAREGMKSFDNDRYLRIWWEVNPQNIGREKPWVRMAKGGGYTLFYSDFPLVLNWHKNGAELQATNQMVNGSTSQVRQASDYWYRSGVTYSKRSAKGFSARILPSDCIFTSNGPAILLNEKSEYSNAFLLGWINSTLVRALIQLQANFADYSTGSIKKLPWIPLIEVAARSELETITYDLAVSRRNAIAQNETSNWFGLSYEPLSSTKFTEATNDSVVYKNDPLHRINEIVNQAYQVTEIAWSADVLSEQGIDESLEDEDPDELTDGNSSRRSDICSIIIGYVLGRWDIRYATGEKPAPALPDPFDPLPVCPPGMLQNAQGLPATPADVPADYPLRISWGGILCDDAGHPEDIEARVRDALRVIWGERADAIEQEACDILGVASLREYFRKPALFFADHLKRYSKSRRQAPIYWPLSTPAGGYTLWLYYHRLTDQTLYTCVNDFVEPKLRSVSAECLVLSKKQDRSAKESRALEQLEALAEEMRAFREELLRVAAFWKPNLNDGVQITAAPLWRLFQHKPWQKKLRETWAALEAGEYDWAHLAYSIWPDRVREKCKTDKSLAIAHDLEQVFVEPPASAKRAKKTPARQKKETLTEDMFDGEDVEGDAP